MENLIIGPYLIIIANPTAGKGKSLKIWPPLEHQLVSKKWKYEIHWTKHPGHAAGLASTLVQKKPNFIISLGGDGTAHEVIEGITKSEHDKTGIVFTTLPVGTGNDWSYYWKIPSDLKLWLAMIEHKKTCFQDLGLVQYTDQKGILKTAVFNNVAGMAYDAYVAHFIESKKKKMRVGGLQYLYFIFRCLFGYTLQSSTIRWNGQSVTNHFYTINVGLCPYSGGGLRLVPHADPMDGLLAVTAVKPLNKLQVFLMTRHFYSGKLHLHPKSIGFQTEELYVEPVDPGEKIGVEAEGEFLGYLPARFSILRKAITICIP